MDGCDANAASQFFRLARAPVSRRHGSGRRSIPSRAPGPGRRKLDDPEAIIEAKVGVEPPTEPRVELLRAVDIRDGDDDHFELHVDPRDARVDTTDYICAHSCLLCCVIFLPPL